MQLEALKVFCDVARRGSFSVAARENGISQSRASQTVRQLEEELRVSLIDRSSRPPRLTAEGRLFFEGCMEILARYDTLKERLGASVHKLTGSISVGAIYSVGIRHMGMYIDGFAEREPSVRIKLEYLHPDQVVERILAGTLDLGIISFPRPHRRLAITPWQEELMVIACYPEHPLAAEQEVSLSRIDGERMVGFDRGLEIRRRIDRFLSERGVATRVELEFDNIESIKRAVEAGTGIALLPRPTFEKEVDRGTLAAVHLAGEDFCRPLSIIRRKGAVNPTADKFGEFLLRGQLQSFPTEEV
jgi:DNA-binding transcriptional LysR family regulator